MGSLQKWQNDSEWQQSFTYKQPPDSGLVSLDPEHLQSGAIRSRSNIINWAAQWAATMATYWL